jgi:hypothetical protein
MALSVVWNQHGFQLIDVPSMDTKFNAGHYVSYILSPLPEIPAPYQNDPRRLFVIDADKARYHSTKTVAQS